ncbi:transcriptional regulator [Aliidiomarina sedimenti]|uniref:Transcriptional regulator n=1 Tax=Aliidiomarina sedimenti TaxID=1933879 RepID=A0ABY0C4K1_9GAMM|nr:BolA/IbaG family iron-sulfur metabolism protein [Aliidiomarina sedimenti]RUO32260.1 transcriptional regulator [Aliidiomarina sedimenti]
MSMQQVIEQKLERVFTPEYLEVLNESHMHSGPATESHFKVIIVSSGFKGERLLNRHRSVNEVLADELAEHIHALALHTYTPDEWVEKGNAPLSPACRGGSKTD